MTSGFIFISHSWRHLGRCLRRHVSLDLFLDFFIIKASVFIWTHFFYIWTAFEWNATITKWSKKDWFVLNYFVVLIKVGWFCVNSNSLFPCHIHNKCRNYIRKSTRFYLPTTFNHDESIFLSRVEGRGFHVEGEGTMSRVEGYIFFSNFFFFGKGNNRCNQCH